MSWLFAPGCSCCTTTIPTCCSDAILPATAELKYTIQGLSQATLMMTKNGNGYFADENICETDDGVTVVVIQSAINCFGGSWALSFAVSVLIYINEFEAILANYVVWNYSLLVGTSIAQGTTLRTNETFIGTSSIACEPCFHLTFTGVNTEGNVTGSANPQTCDGIDYPFAFPGELGLDLEIVGICPSSMGPMNTPIYSQHTFVPEVEEPTLLEKAANLTKAVVKHVASGFKTTTDEEFKQRINICGPCPFNKAGTCIKCGCLISVKAGWASENCPMDYWPVLTDEKGCGCGP